MNCKRPSIDDFVSHRSSIGIIGLGYVGLPLACGLAEVFDVVGFDVSNKRLDELRRFEDRNKEIASEVLCKLNIKYVNDPVAVRACSLLIITVPTPIDNQNNPDLGPLTEAVKTVGQNLSHGATVVFESTVYPGCTEERCIPLLEIESGKTCGEDFFVGYSPERVNPGDKQFTIKTTRKIVAGDCPETSLLLSEIYKAFITEGTYVAPSIKVAEAAKVVENTQRDLNIALVNELALIFDRLGISTLEVLEAAGSKFNFHRYSPGLVGGHCIGVDPYYLTWKAESVGYEPKIILAGRQLNDQMGKIVAAKTIEKILESGRSLAQARVLILGWTFKEDVNDIRNSRVFDIWRELEAHCESVAAFDPLADIEQVKDEYGVELLKEVGTEVFDVVVIAVKHRKILDEFKLNKLIRLGGKKPPVIIDVKSAYPVNDLREAGAIVWQL